MCLFTGPVGSVEDTTIFGRLESGRQYLVYAMAYSAKNEVAMILPLPTAEPDEAQFEFISLANYRLFFKEMADCFPPPEVEWRERSVNLSLGALPVTRVGSFDATFVPRQADFSRIDPRFQFPQETWNKLSCYKDFSFAVFQLREGRSKIHPMALSFLTRESTRVFFPTMHLHDGVIHDEAPFNHVLYSQGVAAKGRWERSLRLPAQVMDRKHAGTSDWTHGLVDPERHLIRRQIVGMYPNEDIWQAVA